MHYAVFFKKKMLASTLIGAIGLLVTGALGNDFGQCQFSSDCRNYQKCQLIQVELTLRGGGERESNR